MYWSSPQIDGWNPRLSPDVAFVSFGAGECFVAPVAPNAIPVNLGSGYAGRWLSKEWLVFADGNKTVLSLYNPRTTQRKTVALAPDLAVHNWMDANDGVLVLCASGRRVVRCTLDCEAPSPVPVTVTILAETGALAPATAGGWVAMNYPVIASPQTYGVRRWAPDGTIRDTVTPTANLVTINADGYVGFGYWGPAQIIVPETGKIETVSCVPWGETPPAFVTVNGELWIFTGTVSPSNELFIIGRKHGDSGRGHVFRQQPPLGVSVVATADGRFVVAGCADHGELVVQDCPIDAPLEAIPAVSASVDEDVVPVAVPAYSDPKWVGWWGAYGRGASMYQGPSHPEAPSNCALCGPADVSLVPPGVPIIFGCTDADRDLAIPLWNRVAALIAYADTSDRAAAQQEVERQAADAHAWMEAHGLTRRPIWSYTAGHVIAAAGVDWSGIQCYFESALSDGDWATFWSGAVGQLPPDQPVVLISQAYSRVMPYWQQRPHALANLQRHFARTLADPRVRGIFPFAWARGNPSIPDGSIFQPLIAAWYRAMVAAVAVPPLDLWPAPTPVQPPAPEGPMMPDAFPAPATPFVKTGQRKWNLPEPLCAWLENEIYAIRQIIAEEMSWRTPAEREALMPQALTWAIWGASLDGIRQNYRKTDEWKAHHA